MEERFSRASQPKTGPALELAAAQLSIQLSVF